MPLVGARLPRSPRSALVLALGLGLLLILPRGGHADDAPPASPPPASPPPASPPLVASAYLDHAAVRARIEDLAKRAQAAGVRFTQSEYGRSHAGQPLVALWVGDCAARPVVLVHGGLAANDAAGSVAVLDLAERLLGEEGREPLRKVGFLLLPAPNPDALDAFLTGRPRAGGGACDRDKDGTAGEDGPEDVDGDGVVRRLRRRSPRGVWAAGPEVGKPGTPEADPRRMVLAGEDGRRSASYELVPEGLDSDGDGQVDEDPPGLDLTRALAGVWDHQGPWGGEGDYPGQAPEARALMDLSFDLPNLLAWYGFRSEGPCLLRASEHGALADQDNALYERMGPALEKRAGLTLRRASERVQGRNPGSDLDWASAHLGVVAFAVPIWRLPGVDPAKAAQGADEGEWLAWADTHLGPGAFQPWTPFPHPTWGAVEVGGWAPFTRLEPPPAHLGAAVRAVSAAPLAQAEFVPALALDVSVEDRGQGLFEVRARVRNVGAFPTETPLAQARRRAHPIRLTLEPEAGVERLAGAVVFDAGVLAPGASSAQARWLLRRDPPRVNRAPEPLLASLRAGHRFVPTERVEVLAP